MSFWNNQIITSGFFKLLMVRPSLLWFATFVKCENYPQNFFEIWSDASCLQDGLNLRPKIAHCLCNLHLAVNMLQTFSLLSCSFKTSVSMRRRYFHTIKKEFIFTEPGGYWVLYLPRCYWHWYLFYPNSWLLLLLTHFISSPLFLWFPVISLLNLSLIQVGYWERELTKVKAQNMEESTNLESKLNLVSLKLKEKTDQLQELNKTYRYLNPWWFRSSYAKWIVSKHHMV